MSKTRNLFWGVLFIILGAFLFSPTTVLGENAEIDEKSERYFKALLKRPEPGYLFERFCISFLDSGTREQLEAYLKTQANTEGHQGRLLLGYFYISGSDYNAAIDAFSQVIKNDPQNVPAYLHRGNAYLSVLDFTAAIEDYKAALSANEDQKEAIEISRQLSKAYIRCGRQKEAISLWENLLAERNQEETLYEDLIELYIEEELYDQALKLSDELLAKTTDSYEKVMRMLRKGDIYQFSGDDTAAINLYSESLAFVGQGSWLEKEILAQISRVFSRQENKKGLEEHFAELIEIYPGRVSLVHRYCQILSQNGKNDQAIETFTQVLKLSPGQKNIAWEYVQLLTAANKTDKAIEAMESLVHQYPGDLELQLSLAELYHRFEKTDQAVGQVEKYLAASDKSEYAYTRAGRLLEKFEVPDKAGAIYEEMVTAHPDSIGAKEVLASYLFRTDEKERAASIWKTMALGDDREAVIRCCRTLQGSGFKDIAFEVIQKQFDSFKDDFIFLGMAVEAASNVEEHDLAIEWAMLMVTTADNPETMEDALVKAKAVIKNANRLDASVKELKDTPDRTVGTDCLLAELLSEQGSATEAFDILTAAVKKEPVLALNEQMRMYTYSYQWEKAAETAVRLFSMPKGSSSRNVKNIVTYYRKAWMVEEAMEWIPRWKELSPGSSMPWMVEASILSDQGKITQCIDVLRVAVRKFENNKEILSTLAQNYLNYGKYADAKRVYWKLYDSSESMNDKLSWVDRLATVCRSDGSTEALVDIFKERKQQDRQSVLPRLALARIYLSNGNDELRRRELIEASRLNPDDIQLLFEIARLEEMTGRWQDAVATLNKAKQLDTTDRTDFRIARLYLDYGQEEQGIKMMLDLANSGLSDPREMEKVAASLILQGYPENAVDYLDGILVRFTDDWRLKYLRAIALEESDKLVDATDAFIELLDEETEIKGLKLLSQQTSANSSYNYYDRIKQIMPPRAVELMKLSSTSYQAYAYNRNLSSGYYVSTSGGMSSLMQLPNDVETLKNQSVIHIVNIQYLLDDASVTQRIVEQMTKADIADAKLLVQIPFRNGYQFDIQRATDELIEKFPGNEIVLAIDACWNSDQIETAVCRKEYDTFHETYPMLAVVAGLKLYMLSEEKDEKVLNDCFDLLEAMEKPDAMAVELLMSSVSQMMRFDVETDATLNRQLSNLLVQWYENCDEQGPYNIKQSLFRELIRNFMQTENYDGMVKLINTEMTDYQTRGTRNPAVNQQMYYNNRGRFIDSLMFPPMELPGYPAQILSLFNGYGDNYGFNSGFLDPAEMAKYADKIEDKLLRVYAYQFTEQAEKSQQLLETLINQSGNDPAVQMYRAAQYFEQEQFIEAAELLARTRQVIKKPDQQQMIDRMIVSSVVSFFEPGDEITSELSEEKCTEVKELGQKAALRLRRERLSTSQRSELADAMRTIGLTKDAEQIERQVAAVGTTSGSQQIYASGSQYMISTQYNHNNVRKMFETGKQKQALKLIQKYLENTARNEIMNPGMNNSTYEIRRIRELLDTNGGSADLIELCKPEQTTASRSWLIFAKVCEYLDDSAQAKAAYFKVLELKPNDSTANLYAAMYSMENDPNKTDDYIAKVNKRSISGILQQLYQKAQNSYEDPFGRFDSARLTIALLKHPAIDNRTDLGYAACMLNVIAQSFYIQTPNHQNFNSLFRNSRQTLSPDMQKIADERRNLFIQLAQALYETPTACDFAYVALMNYDRANDVYDPNTAMAMARETIKRYYHAPSQISCGSSRISSQLLPIAPCEVLLEDAFKRTNFEAIVSELKQYFIQNNNREAAQQVVEFGRLYTVDSEEFSNVAGNYLRRFRSYGQSQVISTYNPFLQILMIAEHRKDVEVADLICDHLKKNFGNINISSSDLAESIKTVLRSQGSEEAQKSLERICETLTTTADKRYDFCLKYGSSQGGYTQGSNNHKARLYYDLLRNLAGEQQLFPAVCRQFVYIPAGHTQNMYNIANTARNLMNTDDIEKAAKLLTETGFMGSPDEMLLVACAAENQRYTMLNSMVFYYALQDDSRKKTALSVLEKCPDSFAKTLIVAMLNDNTDAVADTLQENLEAIKQLSAQKQNQLAQFIFELNGSPDLEVGPEYASASEWFQTILSEGVNEELENFLNTSSAKIISQYTSDYQLIEMMTSLARTVMNNPEQFNQLMQRGEELYDRGVRMKRYSQRSESFREYFFQRLINSYNSQDVPPMIMKMYIDMARPRGSTINRIEYYYIREPIRNYTRQIENDFKPGETEQAALKKLIQYVAQVYGKGNATAGFRSAFMDLLSRHYNRPEDFYSLVATLESLKEASEYDNIIDEMIAATRTQLVDRERDANKKELLKEQVVNYYLTVLRDDELSESWRFSVYSELGNYSSYARNDPRVTQCIVRLAIDYMQSGDSQFGVIYSPASTMLRQFVGMEHTEEWKNLSVEFMDAFSAIHAKMLKSNTRYGLSSDFWLFFLQLHFEAVGADNQDGVNRVVKMSDGKLWQSAEVYPMLVKYGLTELARSMLVTHKRQIESFYYNFERIYMTPELEKKMDAFLAGFEDPEDAFYARAVLWLMQDDRNNDNRALLQQQRPVRLAEIAKGYVEVLFKNDISETRLLNALLSETTTYGILEPVVTKKVEGQDCMAMLGIDDSNSRQFYKQLFKAYYTRSLQKGQSEQVIETFKTLPDYLNSDREWERIQWISEFLRAVDADYLSNNQPSKEYTTALADAYGTLFEIAAGIKINYWHNMNLFRHIQTYAMLSVIDGRCESFAKLPDSLDDNNLKQQFNQRLRVEEVFRQLCQRQLRSPIDTETFFKNLTALSEIEMVKNQLYNEWVGKNMTLCRYLFDKRFFNAEYLMAHQEILEEQIKPDWLLYVDLAYLYSQGNNKNFEEFQQCHEKALEKATEPADQVITLIERAWFLKTSFNRPDLVGECYDKLPLSRDKLDKWIQEKYDATFNEVIQQRKAEVETGENQSQDDEEAETTTSTFMDMTELAIISSAA